jgi:divalent metal cation (Fe/Co/Zn/Cd) transporter
MDIALDKSRETGLYRKAYFLAWFTVIYNVIEGIVSIAFGVSDETLTLFGFGVDSFIEVISGIGVVFMLTRIKNNPGAPKSQFEKTALRITGYSFFALSLGLLAGLVMNIINGHKPEATFAGVVISLVSIAVMIWLASAKIGTGKKLGSEPVIADGNCTKVCVYMSIVLLVSSLVYELTGFAWADAIGTLGIIYFSVSEGRESLEKARGKECDDCC